MAELSKRMVQLNPLRDKWNYVVCNRPTQLYINLEKRTHRNKESSQFL